MSLMDDYFKGVPEYHDSVDSIKIKSEVKIKR